jgi:hypothetical protein
MSRRSAPFWPRRWESSLELRRQSAGVAAWMRFTASGKAAAQFLFDVFKPTLDIIGETLGGIGDALMAGNLQLAGQIAVTGCSCYSNRASTPSPSCSAERWARLSATLARGLSRAT